MRVKQFNEFLNEEIESISKEVAELEKKIWDSKNGPAKLEWEEISQTYLDGEGREQWVDLDDRSLQNVKQDAQALLDKYKIR